MMNLQSRVLLLYLGIGLMVLVLIGGVLPAALQKQNLNSITNNSIGQLKQIDFALSNFIGEVKHDVSMLSLDHDVMYRDDSEFTNFLHASEETFRYNISAREQAIVDVLRDYQSSHPYVNSVYMGRENGAFVRSYPRARPTAYDPRDRPWYILARGNPGQVMVTEPYSAVTTPDVNIGIVTTLIDRNGTVYGVVGTDITLVNLTSYISTIDRGDGGEMILTDRNGIILAGRDPSLLFTNISAIIGDQAPVFLGANEGIILLNGSYLTFYSSPDLGWKIGEFIPFRVIEEDINATVQGILLFVIIALILLSAITILILNYTIIRPLSSLTEASRKIAGTGNLDQEIDTGGSTSEIRTLALSFQAMVGKIRTEQEARKEAIAKLEEYRDHLEDLIADRTRELAVAKDAAESADRLKSAFLATMSHELRTPLNSIIGFSGILLEGLAGPLNEEQTRQLSMISESSDHLLALINDVLDLSKIEAGQLWLASEPYNLRDVIEKVIRVAKPLAEAKHLALETRISPGVGSIRGDSRRVEQVLLNLVSNAIKFTDQGQVTVSCLREGDNLVVRVKDTGIGIRQDNFDKLFKPFSQIETGLSRQYEGTGLGLSISKKLVEMMGGSISVESEWGRGSTFSVVLPIGSVNT